MARTSCRALLQEPFLIPKLAAEPGTTKTVDHRNLAAPTLLQEAVEVN
jgi:hypothetical protein